MGDAINTVKLQIFRPVPIFVLFRTICSEPWCWQVDQAVQHDNELCQDAALTVDPSGDQPLPPWSKEEAFGSPFLKTELHCHFSADF